MATSSVDNDRKSANITRTREQASKQEAELKKKHAAEVNRIQKAYGEKVRELQKTHEEQLEAVRSRGQEALSEKDKKYQSQIDKIKNAHTQATKNSAQNFDREVRQLEDNHEGELNKINQIHDSQTESLSKNYETDIKNKEANFTTAVDEMREEQADALNNQKERLESHYTKNSNILRDNQDGRINELTNQLQSTREQKNAEIKGLKISNLSDRQKMENDKMSLLQQERKTQEMHKDNMRDQYSKNLSEIREKYGRYNNESRSGRAVELQNMQTMAAQKNNQQVGTLKRRIREQNVAHDDDKFQMRNEFRDEKKAYLDATKEALQNAEKQRSQIVDATNLKTASEIQDMTNRHADILDRQGKYYKSRIGEMELKYDESINNQVKSLEVENRQDRLKSDHREQKLSYMLGKDKNESETYYKDLLSEKDRAHKDDMATQRLSMLKERNEAVSSLEDRMREMDAKNSEKMNQLIMKYEKELSDVKDENKADKKRMTDQFNRRIDEMDKTRQFQLDAERVSSKNREDQLKEKFERNISQMEIKHDEEKIRMASILKK